MVLESELRTILRDASKFRSGTISFVEFAPGGDPGVADCLIADGSIGGLRPVELKRGNSVLKELRPSQIRWHKDQLRLGVRTFGLSISIVEDRIYGFELKIEDRDLAEILIFDCIAERFDYDLVLNDLFKITS